MKTCTFLKGNNVYDFDFKENLETKIQNILSTDNEFQFIFTNYDPLCNSDVLYKQILDNLKQKNTDKKIRIMLIPSSYKYLDIVNKYKFDCICSAVFKNENKFLSNEFHWLLSNVDIIISYVYFDIEKDLQKDLKIMQAYDSVEIIDLTSIKTKELIDQEKSKIDCRGKLIIDKRNLGTSYKQIANELCLSTTRVMQIESDKLRKIREKLRIDIDTKTK